MSRSRSKKPPQWKVDNAIGDGNCAFNAFVLGLCRPEILAHVKNQIQGKKITENDFFNEAAKALKLTSLNQTLMKLWQAISKEITKLHNDGDEEKKKELQNALAPVMRELACKLAKEDKNHIERTIQPLLSAYDVDSAGEDIFLKHKFIRLKMKDFKEGSAGSVETAKYNLEQWWRNKGYNQFLEEMKEPGEWAGDLELFQLARFFRVELLIEQKSVLYEVYRDYTKLTKSEIEEALQNNNVSGEIANLISRGVIGPLENNQYYPVMLKREEVAERLDVIPSDELIIKYLDGLGEDQELKNQPVPTEWGVDVIRHLRDRGVVTKKENALIFCLTKKEAFSRIISYPQREQIISLVKLKNAEPLPEIRLEHTGDHWNNMLPSVQQQPERRQRRRVRNPVVNRSKQPQKHKPVAETPKPRLPFVGDEHGITDYVTAVKQAKEYLRTSVDEKESGRMTTGTPSSDNLEKNQARYIFNAYKMPKKRTLRTATIQTANQERNEYRSDLCLGRGFTALFKSEARVSFGWPGFMSASIPGEQAMRWAHDQVFNHMSLLEDKTETFHIIQGGMPLVCVEALALECERNNIPYTCSSAKNFNFTEEQKNRADKLLAQEDKLHPLPEPAAQNRPQQP